MIELAVAAAVVGAAALAGVGFHLKARPVWKKFAEEHDLTLESAQGAMPRLRGQRRGFEFVLHGFGRNDASVEIREVDPWFTLAPGGASESRHALGDPGFDAQVRVGGDRDFALSLLHYEVRRLAETIVPEHRVQVENGSIRAHVDGFRQAPHQIDPLLRLAEQLRRPSSNDLPPLLVRNALEDPVPGFRVLALRQLATAFPKAPETRPTATRLLRDEQAELRLEAARHFLAQTPEDCATAITVLEEIVEQPSLEASVRGQALDAVARFGDSESAVRLALAILADDEPSAMRVAAIEALIHTKASEQLMELTPTADVAELRVLARGLGQIGDSRAQRTLLPMLERPQEDLQIAIAAALGTIGTARAVPVLRRAAAVHADPKSAGARAVAQAAEAAVVQIQHRLGGRQAGEVSITSVEPLEGAVSPADESPDVPEGGEVSLADRE